MRLLLQLRQVQLKGHDGGKTFDIVYRTLTEHLGYTVYHKIIDSQSVVPQHRERIFSR